MLGPKDFKVKDKKCKECLILFTPLRPLQSVCSPKCAIAHNKMLEAKKEKKEWSKEKAVLKDKITSKAEWLNIAQKVFNTYIRMRDKALPCISCGTNKQDIQYHAGHFYAVGGYSNLRFDEDNVHKQCGNYCNKNLHGNLIAYSEQLPLRIGIERFEALKSRRGQVVHYSIPEIKEMIQHYKIKIKKLC
jgi:hypothetical protein